jgi:hypothetical protein
MSADMAQAAVPYMAQRAAVIGRYVVDSGFEFLPVAERELQRAQEAAGQVLDTYGFARGRCVLLISTLGDIAQVLPLQRALAERNLISCTADASSYEFGRIRSMIQRFDIAAVLGVTAAVLDGLASAGIDVATLFAGKVVWARPDAYARLSGVSAFELRRWIDVGPALALECRCGTGAHIDGREWRLDDGGGELRVSSRLDRLRAFDATPTGLRATLARNLCACGHPGPRIVL